MASPMPSPEFVYKVAGTDAVRAAEGAGAFPRMPIDDKDGYTHFSTEAQLRETLRLHFAGQGGLMLLAVPTSTLGAGLRWEPSRGGQMFPHHYGPLGWSVVARLAPIAVAEDGSVSLPDWVR
jgi:uncharacterized protein (DUF952 family)